MRIVPQDTGSKFYINIKYTSKFSYMRVFWEISDLVVSFNNLLGRENEGTTNFWNFAKFLPKARA